MEDTINRQTVISGKVIADSTEMQKEVKMLLQRIKKSEPNSEEMLFSLFDELVSTHIYSIIATIASIVKKETILQDLKYISHYESWLFNHAINWGYCDILCYRILNPMLEKYQELFKNIYEWTYHQNPMVRRAAAVSLIHSSQTFWINVPFKHVEKISNILIKDENKYVQNGIGWLLKYSYISYPSQTLQYLKNNVNQLQRSTLRYALEKMDADTKKTVQILRG